jgi:hypothetical protein
VAGNSERATRADGTAKIELQPLSLSASFSPNPERGSGR